MQDWNYTRFLKKVSFIKSINFAAAPLTEQIEVQGNNFRSHKLFIISVYLLDALLIRSKYKYSIKNDAPRSRLFNLTSVSIGNVSSRM